MIAELPYADIQCAFDGEAGFRNYDERGIAWTKTVRDDMAPFATEGAYLNFTRDEGRDRIVAGYGGPARYQRLAAVKDQSDPDNVLRLNHNIEPLS